MRRGTFRSSAQDVSKLQGLLLEAGIEVIVVPNRGQLWAERLTVWQLGVGITGLWQVSGRSDTSFATYSRLDAFYAENWSLRGDLAILGRTLPAVLRSRGAY